VSTLANGHHRSLNKVRLFRDHPDKPVCNKTTFRVNGNRGVNIRFLCLDGRLLIHLAGNVMELIGGREAVTAALGAKAGRIDFVNALRLIPSPGDQIHSGIFAPIEDFEALDRVAAEPDLVRGLKRVREIAERNEAIRGNNPPAKPAPVAVAAFPVPPPAAPKMDALKDAARAKIAAERKEVETVRTQLAALQEAVLEAYTRPDADEQLAALRLIAEGLL
jgi:hypothetical protein